MSSLTRWMDATLYPRHGNNWDDEIFRTRLLEYIGPDKRCLDFGSGRGKVKQMNFKGIAGWMAGVDPDRAVFDNPYLDDAALLDLKANHIPYPDASFDVVFADNVMEHVGDPTAVFSEIRRVLKPGGRFLAKTPNKWHYMPAIARITPTWFHRFYNGLRGRQVTDTFPTRYRSNSATDVRAHLTVITAKQDKVEIDANLSPDRGAAKGTGLSAAERPGGAPNTTWRFAY